MQLRVARLCLDCEEVHSEQHCPVCASERFGYLSRWVPVEERRERPRLVVERTSPNGDRALRWAKRGAAGIALVAVSRWLWTKGRSLAETGPDTSPEKPRSV